MFSGGHYDICKHQHRRTLEQKPLSLEGFTIFANGKDGVEVEIEGEFIEAGTAEYDEFIEKLRKA